MNATVSRNYTNLEWINRSAHAHTDTDTDTYKEKSFKPDARVKFETEMLLSFSQSLTSFCVGKSILKRLIESRVSCTPWATWKGKLRNYNWVKSNQQLLSALQLQWHYNESSSNMYRSNGRHRCFFLGIFFLSQNTRKKETGKTMWRSEWEENVRKIRNKFVSNGDDVHCTHTKQMLVIVSFLMRAKKLSF